MVGRGGGARKVGDRLRCCEKKEMPMALTGGWCSKLIPPITKKYEQDRGASDGRWGNAWVDTRPPRIEEFIRNPPVHDGVLASTVEDESRFHS